MLQKNRRVMLRVQLQGQESRRNCLSSQGVSHNDEWPKTKMKGCSYIFEEVSGKISGIICVEKLPRHRLNKHTWALRRILFMNPVA